MSFFDRVKKQLERDEGRKEKLYNDSLGIPTIGIGRNMQRPLSNKAIDFLFEEDYDDHFRDLVKALPWAIELDEARLGALLNMYFNLGPKLLQFQSMLPALKEGRWEDAARHALNSVWASQVHGRAKRIAQQFITGVWQ